jgi:hypothetical protein
MNDESDQLEDIEALQKDIRLHDLQFSQLKQMINDLALNINEFMKYTNQTLKLHEEGIGIVAARSKALERQLKDLQRSLEPRTQP